MTRFLVLMLSGLTLSVFTVAQTEDESHVPQNVYINIPGRNMIRIEASNGLAIPKSRLEGTPYLFEDWKTGRLIVEGNQIVKDFTFNLNVYNNRLEFKHEDKLMSITQPEKVVRVEYGERIFRYRAFKGRNDTKHAYMELLEDGPMQLYKRFECKLLEPSYNEALAVGNRNYRLMHNQSYYLGKNQEPLFEIKTRKRSVLKTLADKKAKIRSFIRKNNINLNEDDGMIHLIRYYNQLQD